MRYLPSILFIAFMGLVGIMHAQTETNKYAGLNFIKLPNSMNAVVMQEPSAVNAQISLHLRAGSVFEDDSITGISAVLQKILADRIISYLQRNTGGINKNNTAFTSFTTTEQTIFQFSGPAQYIPEYLKVLHDSVFLAVVTPEELKSKSEELYNSLDKQKTDPKVELEKKQMENLFRIDYYRADNFGNSMNYSKLDTSGVNSYQRKFYVAANAILGVAGNISGTTFQQQFEKAYSDIYRTDFNPETITKIIDFKLMLYSTQFVVEGETDKPEFQICWQFPGTHSSPASAYVAYLVSALLNDPNNYLQVKARKMGCSFLQFQYEANNFSAVFRVIVRPDKNNLVPTYNFVMNELLRLDKTLVNETMINAAKVKFNQEYKQLTQTLSYPEWVIKYWPYQDQTYFGSLNDSVMSISEKAVRRFVIEYMRESPRTTSLYISKADRDALGVDSSFFEIGPEVNDYVFTYKQNVTDLEGEQNIKQLHKLLQWLQINSDIQAQINGCADEGEFNKAYDDSIIAFIDSTESFQKANPDLVKKRYLRPEMMRAMKIIKYLADSGIDVDRLSGTSMIFKSANRQEAISNMKCTLSLDKLRKHISLYEYHYGTPKPKE